MTKLSEAEIDKKLQQKLFNEKIKEKEEARFIKLLENDICPDCGGDLIRKAILFVFDEHRVCKECGRKYDKYFDAYY